MFFTCRYGRIKTPLSGQIVEIKTIEFYIYVSVPRGGIDTVGVNPIRAIDCSP